MSCIIEFSCDADFPKQLGNLWIPRVAVEANTIRVSCSQELVGVHEVDTSEERALLGHHFVAVLRALLPGKVTFRDDSYRKQLTAQLDAAGHDLSVRLFAPDCPGVQGVA